MATRNNGDLETMVKKEYDKLIVIPDAHFPYQDEQTYKTVLNFVKDQKPDRIILLGDFIDMYSVSKYDKNPERANRLQHELDQANEGLSQLRKAAPLAKIEYIEGNHEARLQKYLWRHPEVHGLRTMKIQELLGLKDLKINYVDEIVWKNVLMFTHGKYCNKYSSRSELDAAGISGISGHTHRLQMSAKTDRGGEKVWYSLGNICDPKQAEYTAQPDWQQAVGLAYLSTKNSRFFVEAIPITEHKFLYGGKLYNPQGVTKLG